MTESEKFLDQLLLVYKNNPIFRDNLAFLTQSSLRNLPAHIINESINRMEDFFRYESSAPPRV